VNDRPFVLPRPIEDAPLYRVAVESRRPFQRAEAWGKVMEALAPARAMSDSRRNLDRHRASLKAMFSYAELKSVEP
jgi:hypothetical protein